MNDGKMTEMIGKIREEVSSLAVFIDRTRRGIDSLESTVKVGSEKFPEASSQLKTVTGDLENAANTIMTILESLMEEQDKASSLIKELSSLAGEEGKKVSELQKINDSTKASMMEIFSHMSFHDLSGQKLKKVITSLAVVESKLLEIAMNFGLLDGNGKGQDEILAELKNRKEEKPINQDIVDQLLKELGA